LQGCAELECGNQAEAHGAQPVREAEQVVGRVSPLPGLPSAVELEAPDAFVQWCSDNLVGIRGNQEEFTVVLLGQTGAGKTLFSKFMFLFDTILRHGDPNLAPDFCRLENQQMEEAAADPGRTLTLGPLKLRIVDTPGFGGLNGLEVEEPLKGIVDCLRPLGPVHAIGLVVNGRESIMTSAIKCALTEVCSLLPSTARENVLVVFTNCSTETHCNFRQQGLSEAVHHTVTPDRKIYIDNPYSLWKNAMAQDRVGALAVQQKLVAGCRAAAAGLGKFFVQVSQMPRMDSDVFESRYRLREAIERDIVLCLQQGVSVPEQELLRKVRNFDKNGLVQYAVLLGTQRDMAQEQLERSRDDQDVRHLRRQVDKLGKQLRFIQATPPAGTAGWARWVLDVTEDAPWGDVQYKHRRLISEKEQPRQQLDDAINILREHLGSR